MVMSLACHRRIVFDSVESFAGRTFNAQRSTLYGQFGLDISAVLMKKVASQASRSCVHEEVHFSSRLL